MIPKTSRRVANGTIKINNGFVHIYSNIYVYVHYTNGFFKLTISADICSVLHGE